MFPVYFCIGDVIQLLIWFGTSCDMCGFLHQLEGHVCKLDEWMNEWMVGTRRLWIKWHPTRTTIESCIMCHFLVITHTGLMRWDEMHPASINEGKHVMWVRWVSCWSCYSFLHGNSCSSYWKMLDARAGNGVLRDSFKKKLLRSSTSLPTTGGAHIRDAQILAAKTRRPT